MKVKAIAAALAFAGGTMLAGPVAAQDDDPGLNSEQPGSALIFPLFDVSGTKKTTIRISNTSASDSVDVHLVRVCGAEKSFGGEGFCTASDREQDFSPMQTRVINVQNFFNVDSNNCPTGFIVAYAKIGSKQPLVFNHLIGSTYIRDSGSGKLRAEGAQAIPVQSTGKQEGSTVEGSSGGAFPVLPFDGDGYHRLPYRYVTDFRANEGNGVGAKGSRIALATLDIKAGQQNDPTLIAIDANNQNEVPVSASLEYVCHVVTSLQEGTDPTKPGPDGFPGGGSLERSNLGSQFGKLQLEAFGEDAIVGQIEEFENNRATLRNLFHTDDFRSTTFTGR